MTGKIRKSNKVFAIISVTVLGLYTISLLFPLLWALLSSFKDRLDFRFNMFGWPEQFMWSNYSVAFRELFVEVGSKKIYTWQMLGNTIIYAVGSTVINTLVNCVTAYIVCKYNRFRVTKIIYTFVIVSMILPIVGSLPSEIQMARSLGFYDNIFGVFVMKAYFGGTNFLIFYATFKGISWEYAESAIIDGAGHFQVLTRVMMPLARTTIAALALLAFIGYWNDYYTPMIYLPSMPTIAYGLYRFQFSNITDAGSVTVQLAACMIVTIPIFIIYMCFKKYLSGNLSMGGLKG